MFEYPKASKELMPKFKKTFEMEVSPFFERYNLLNCDKNLKKVVIIKNVFDNSTFRYRGVNIAESMKDSKKYIVTYFNESELPKIYSKLSSVSMIILQRASWSVEMQNLITFARTNHIKLVYDLDDLIYKSNYVVDYLNNVSDNENKQCESFMFAYCGYIDSIAQQCDEFISTTPLLSKSLSSDYKKPCHIIRNFFNNIQFQASKSALQLRSEKQGFCVGYFSGSSSHAKDFEIAEKALVKLMDKYEDFFVVIVGFMDFIPEFDKYIKNGRVKIYDFVGYEFLPYLNALVDVNLVPLLDNKFNNCKSELKYFEASLLKMPSIVSKLQVYDNIINDGVNGIFATEDEWEEKLEYLYLNPSEVEKIGLNAYKHSIEKYSPKNVCEDIEKVYDQILNNK